MLTITQLIQESHGTAVEKGWWEDWDRNFGEMLMLFITEITEVWEEISDDGIPNPAQWITINPDTQKPEGLAVEFADLLIRAADTVGRYELPLVEALKSLLSWDKVYREIDNEPVARFVPIELLMGRSFAVVGEGQDEEWVRGNLQDGLLDIITPISHAMEAYRVSGVEDTRILAGHFAEIFIATAALCEDFDVPLEKALEVKLAYNKTRPYRHGGKKA
jgi:hypothetical protein